MKNERRREGIQGIKQKKMKIKSRDWVRVPKERQSPEKKSIKEQEWVSIKWVRDWDRE